MLTPVAQGIDAALTCDDGYLGCIRSVAGNTDVSSILAAESACYCSYGLGYLDCYFSALQSSSCADYYGISGNAKRPAVCLAFAADGRVSRLPIIRDGMVHFQLWHHPALCHGQAESSVSRQPTCTCYEMETNNQLHSSTVSLDFE